MSMRSEAVLLPSRSDSVWLEGFPLIPVLILAGIALLAIFADVLAPYDPEIGNLAVRFRPPAWQARSEERRVGKECRL